jgi:hypothetical protein
MNPFSSSSRQRQRINQDGTVNVYCYSCKQFIGRSAINMTRALCEICRRVEAGEKLGNEEAIRQYRLSRGSAEDVSLLILPDEPPGILAAKKFNFRSIAGEILMAVGIRKPAAEPKQSTRLAKEKRHPRLFATVDLKSMEEVDANLKRGKE